MRFTVPALPAFRRALAKMAADAAPEPGPSGRPSIFPQFSVDAPMPKPRHRPIHLDDSLPPPARSGYAAPELRIVPPDYPQSGAAQCGVCGSPKRTDVVCYATGCPWSRERDTWDEMERFRFGDPVTVEFRGGDGSGFTTGFSAAPTKEELTVSCDRPLPPQPRVRVSGMPGFDGVYTVNLPLVPVRAEPEPPVAPAPPPFDPIRAWADVARAWMRCAYVTAEIPVQLALLHRVSVGL